MSSLTHYSVTTLSQAAAGRMPPSLPVLLAFVEACGGDCEEWERRWRALTADTVPESADPDAAGSDAAGLDAAGLDSRPPARRWRWVLAAVAAGLVFAVIGTLVVLHWRSAPPARGGVVAVEPIADGSEPNRAGCGSGAVTLARVNVHFPATALAGELQLRYSSRCRAAWSRFEPAPSWHPADGVVVTVWTIRPADQATQQYSVPFAGATISGNMLMTLPGCIVVEVSMVQGTTTSPVAKIACQRIGS